jgi:hypothetical protein
MWNLQVTPILRAFISTMAFPQIILLLYLVAVYALSQDSSETEVRMTRESKTDCKLGLSLGINFSWSIYKCVSSRNAMYYRMRPKLFQEYWFA